LIVVGFSITTSALWTMHTLNLGVSYYYLAGLRVFQASGLAFLFVPINTLSYNNIPRNKNNDVSGLTNLARNIGGSVGTAFLTTMLTRRAQAHQTEMVQNLTMSNPAFSNYVSSTAEYLRTNGGMGGPAGVNGPAGFAAMANIYHQLQRQTSMLAYLDVIAVMATFTGLMIPLVFLMQKMKKTGGEAPPAH
jgi:DHA2 family multidrug resistance protein